MFLSYNHTVGPVGDVPWEIYHRRWVNVLQDLTVLPNRLSFHEIYDDLARYSMGHNEPYDSGKGLMFYMYRRV